MATIPPDKFIEWATNAEALSTDPGTTLKANGWAAGDAPAASHFNYLMHAATWSSFIAKAIGSLIAWGNIERTATSPFTTTNSALNIRYDATVNRWYATRRDSLSPYEVEVYDSPDGETWSSAVQIDASTTGSTAADLTECHTDGTRVSVACEGAVYTSTDATVQNMNLTGNTFTAITKCRQLHYSAFHDLWIAVGSDGTNGKIETATDPTGTWTVRYTATSDPFTSFAERPDTGQMVAGTDDAAGWATYDSDDGISWSFSTVDPTSGIKQMYWSPAAERFFAVDDSNNLWRCTDDGETWIDVGINVDHVLQTDEFTWFIEQTTGVVYSYHPLHSQFGYDNVGVITDEEQPGPAGISFDRYTGGAGKLVYVSGAGTEDFLTIARYGAQS
jgi:hypothetical protein